MALSPHVHTKQKVCDARCSRCRSNVFSSILQRELYNMLADEDAQQVLLVPDPSLYK